MAFVETSSALGWRFLGDPGSTTGQLAGRLSDGSGKEPQAGSLWAAVLRCDGDSNFTLLGYFHLGVLILSEIWALVLRHLVLVEPVVPRGGVRSLWCLRLSGAWST